MTSVLITRASEDAGGTAAKIAARGFTPIPAPMLEVMHGTPREVGHVQAVLVTSGNALAALPAGTIPLLAVGDATAARAKAAGFSQVYSAGADAAALAELAATVLRPSDGPLLLAVGIGQGAGLAADLRRRGFRVIRRVCYQVHPVRRFPQAAAQAIASGSLEAAVFMSAETASIFVRLLPVSCRSRLRSVRALAIGGTTAAALEPLGWLRICRASAPTLDDVLALL